MFSASIYGDYIGMHVLVEKLVYGHARTKQGPYMCGLYGHVSTKQGPYMGIYGHARTIILAT